MSQVIEIMDEKAIRRAITRISHEIIEKNKGVKDIILFGIKTRGKPIAERIASNINKFEGEFVPVEVLDATLYRDDLINNNNHSLTKDVINIDINNKIIILVDDVFFTGRTCRAALDAVMDAGRPKKVQLAVIVDRGHKELPIKPDYVGKNVPTSKDEKVHVLLNEVDGKDKVLLTKER